MEESNKEQQSFDEMLVESNIFLEEESDSLEVAGSWGSLGTFGSSVGACASSVGSASSFG